jgi:hypothetical protein
MRVHEEEEGTRRGRRYTKRKKVHEEEEGTRRGRRYEEEEGTKRRKVQRGRTQLYAQEMHF